MVYLQTGIGEILSHL